MGGGLKMATVKLKFVQSFVDRHGHARQYFRRGQGKKTALPGLPGSQAFMDAYAACLADQSIPAAPKQPRGGSRSFAALASQYYGSAFYRDLAVTTKRVYRRVIDRFLLEHGERDCRQMRREHVDRIIGKMSDTPGAGQIMLKRLRTLVRYGMDIKWLSVDPTAGARSYKSKEMHTWTEEEIAQFEAFWPVGTKERLGFALHLYTAQRGSDVHRMAWPDISGDVIRVAQKKTGEKLEIVLHPALREVLAATKRSHVAIIVTEYGSPFSVKGFGQFMSAAIKQAGLPDRCKPHGLRKAAARRVADAGGTGKEIQSVTGHRTLEEVERYTRAADQKRLNRSALAKQLANETVQPSVDQVSTLPKKARR